MSRCQSCTRQPLRAEFTILRNKGVCVATYGTVFSRQLILKALTLRAAHVGISV